MSGSFSISFTQSEVLLILKVLKDFSLEGRGSIDSAYIEEDVLEKYFDQSDKFTVFRKIVEPKQLSNKLLKLTPAESERLVELSNEYSKLSDGVDKLAWRKEHFNIID